MSATPEHGARPARRRPCPKSVDVHRPWSPLKARHLVSLGGDLARCQAAQRVLGRLLDQAPSGDEFRGVLERAAEFIREQLEQIVLAIEGMSAVEYDLLRERNRDEHFQDSCLVTFQQHLRERRYQTFTPFPKYAATHGVWGPLMVVDRPPR